MVVVGGYDVTELVKSFGNRNWRDMHRHALHQLINDSGRPSAVILRAPCRMQKNEINAIK